MFKRLMPESLLIKKEHYHQFAKYILTGLVAFTIEYTLYLILYIKMGFYYITASVIVYAIVFWFSFLVNRYWAFKSKGNIKSQLMLYTLLFAFNLVVSNIAVMYLLTDIIGLSAFVSPFLKTGLVVCWNFFFYKRYIYK